MLIYPLFSVFDFFPSDIDIILALRQYHFLILLLCYCTDGKTETENGVILLWKRLRIAGGSFSDSGSTIRHLSHPSNSITLQTEIPRRCCILHDLGLSFIVAEFFLNVFPQVVSQVYVATFIITLAHYG